MNFVEEWLNRANNEKGEDKAVFRFLCLFIAFNYLYKEHRKIITYRNGNCRYNSEREQIKSLLIKAQECIKDFNPYSVLDEKSEILIEPVKSVFDLRNGIKQDVIDKQKLDDKDINELFYSVYFVRCNLFHGSKVLVEKRDKKLIDECNKILEYFLSKYNASYCLSE